LYLNVILSPFGYALKVNSGEESRLCSASKTRDASLPLMTWARFGNCAAVAFAGRVGSGKRLKLLERLERLDPVGGNGDLEVLNIES
jgi:hypothetical protein